MNLKQKLEQTIAQKKADSDLLSQISTLKSKLASQSSFNLAGYNKLSEIEHSLYRYNTFITGNLTKEADREAQRLSGMVKKLNDENIVLEGGINNSKYVWHTEPNACKICQELDGTVYYTKEDIPEKPHPNCKCTIEEILMDEEACDCYLFFDNIDSVLQEAEDLQANIINEQQDISRIQAEYSNSHSDLIQGMINDLVSLEDPLNTLFQTVSIFLVNYHQMREANTIGADKYFHARANCEAAQKGIVGEMIAKAIGDLREFLDSFKNIYIKKYTLEESLKDIQEDLEANQEGRDLGRKYPTQSPYDLLKHRVPNGLPDRYKH